MVEGPALHPELNLPYGKWIVIGRQSFTGALWFDEFDLPTMNAIDAIVKAQQGWVMQRRVHEAGKPTVSFQRVLWLQTPGFQNWRYNRGLAHRKIS